MPGARVPCGPISTVGLFKFEGGEMNNQRMLEILEEISPHIDPWEFPVGLPEKIHALIDELKGDLTPMEQILANLVVGEGVNLVGAIRAIATALHDTIEDPTLPNHLRKVQLGHLLEHVEELSRAVGK